MKRQNCPAYNKNTEIERTEIGSAYGKPLYREREVILSELCSIYNKIDDFDCKDCEVFKMLKLKEDNK